MYQIQGSRFDQILDPSQVGIFDASKSYFIIFSHQVDANKLKSANS